MKPTLALLLLACSLLLGGCAALRSVATDVSTYGEWPAERKPGSYAFERLPSQQARAVEAEALEAAARTALEKAGFAAAAPGSEPEVLVQLGARSGRAMLAPWGDALWWRGSFGFHRYGPWMGPRWGMGLQYDALRYEREVALLIRDRASGKPLFEAHVSHEGTSTQIANETLAAMFEAALMDFPHTGVNPRRVVVERPE
ncbi:conserved exported hypothetical protein [Rubrivivax sp. A210]|uniref:DUF4136 domain-containing protein n=1 Tax=Rubrivivax sp. A210 TaxID=2772301 RepID=UPI0019A639B7|nr:DUF4136 domain-containing protein [Rubrivivax sp. A210]CAD5374188.1 conserved exported hypothetical protein [Rubrivivax sp. A210]